MKLSKAMEFSLHIADTIKNNCDDIELGEGYISLVFDDGSKLELRERVIDPVFCPVCGEQAERSETQYGRRDDCRSCGLWSWGGKPLVDKETHEARKAAHRAFDSLWRSSYISRSRAYTMLASTLGLSEEECHMSIMSKEVASKVPEAVRTIWKEL